MTLVWCQHFTTCRVQWRQFTKCSDPRALWRLTTPVLLVQKSCFWSKIIDEIMMFKCTPGLVIYLLYRRVSTSGPLYCVFSKKDIIKDITSDSQVNSYFQYRWSLASLTLKIYFYLFFAFIYNKNNDKSHLKSPKNQNRWAALRRAAMGGGIQRVCGRPTLAFSSALAPQTLSRSVCVVDS